MKFISNLFLFLIRTCAVLVFFGIVLKFYWLVFMFGWMLI